MENRERAKEPEDLNRFFLARANAGDVEGVVALYETDAVLANPPGCVTVGIEAIRRVYEQLLATRPAFTGDVLPSTASAIWPLPRHNSRQLLRVRAVR